jgi:hypothetical protein
MIGYNIKEERRRGFKFDIPLVCVPETDQLQEALRQIYGA